MESAVPTGESPLVLYEVDGPLAILSLNRPEKLNALNWPLLNQLSTALERAERDPDVRVVIIRGVGRCFSVGYDLGAEVPHGPKTVVGQPLEKTVWNSRAHVQGHIELWFKIWNLWKPVIAQVHGYCLAGGSELALFCDLTVLADDVRMGYPAVRFTGTGDAQIYPWLVGLKKAKELAFGAILTAEEAVAAGLANRVVPLADLDRATRDWANQIAVIHPELLSLSKRAVNLAYDLQGFRAVIEALGEIDSLCHFGQARAQFRALAAQHGLREAFRMVNEPFGGL